MGRKVFIYGAGRYGKALNKFLAEKGINICGFIQTDVITNKDDNIISFEDFCNEYKKSCEPPVVLVAVGEASNQITNNLVIEAGLPLENVVLCKRFIEENVLNYEKDCFFCNICGNKITEFNPGGNDYEIFKRLNIIGGGRREKSVCPICGGVDRFRFFKIVLEKYTNVFTGRCTILHFAAEEQIAKLIRKNDDANYITADMEKDKGLLSIDMTDIPFKDSVFDYVFANHVLEHVYDLDKALSEIKRVLKPQGTAIFSFPICTNQKTIEDITITDPEMRKKLFCQEDHVRLFGTDYKEIIENAGFTVTSKTAKSELSDSAMKSLALISDDTILLCRKQNLN